MSSKNKTANIVLNEVEVNPLGDQMLDFLMHQKYETPYLDYKYTIDVSKASNFPELAKDIFAFANFGGGWILIGWKENEKRQQIPEGLKEDYSVDQATLQEKFNAYVDSPIYLEYKEFEKEVSGKNLRFGVIFIPPAKELKTPKKEGKYVSKNGKTKLVFKVGEKFFRRGTQSIRASKKEIEIIENRAIVNDYKLSLLSGEPDLLKEKLYSNLFSVDKLPVYVYTACPLDGSDSVTIKDYLRGEGVFPEWYFKFKFWEGRIVTFENIDDSNNVYSGIVNSDTISIERIDGWLSDNDKRRIIVELLNKEVRHFAISKGLFYYKEKNKLYFSTEGNFRKEAWKGRFSKGNRTVATQVFASQLKRMVFWHPSISPNFIELSSKFYLQLSPSFVITDDGKKAISGPRIGTIITRLSYNKHNSSHRDTLLFWAEKLSTERGKIKLTDYLEISALPVSVELERGIVFDSPVSRFREEKRGEKN